MLMRMQRNWITHFFAGCIVKGHSLSGKWVDVSNKIELAIWLNYCTPGHLPQKNEKKCVLHEVITRTFTASILIIVQNWEQLKSPSMDEWLNTMVYPYCGTLLSNTEEQTIGIYNLVDRKMLPPPKKKLYALWSLEPMNMLYYIAKGLCRYKVTDLKIGRVFWITWVGPI